MLWPYLRKYLLLGYWKYQSLENSAMGGLFSSVHITYMLCDAQGEKNRAKRLKYHKGGGKKKPLNIRFEEQWKKIGLISHFPTNPVATRLRMWHSGIVYSTVPWLTYRRRPKYSTPTTRRFSRANRGRMNACSSDTFFSTARFPGNQFFWWALVDSQLIATWWVVAVADKPTVTEWICCFKKKNVVNVKSKLLVPGITATFCWNKKNQSFWCGSGFTQSNHVLGNYLASSTLFHIGKIQKPTS